MNNFYARHRETIAAMANCLKGMPDEALEKDAVRRQAYDQAAAVPMDTPHATYVMLDGAAFIAEVVRTELQRKVK